MVPYEQRLDQDWDWACEEGDRHFAGRSAVHLGLRKFAQRLEPMGIPYAVIGTMAMFFHGLRRFTEDVDVILTRDGLEAVRSRLVGNGYIQPSTECCSLRDEEHGVRIDIHLTGEFPGDGQPRAVAFPDPSGSTAELAGLRVLALPRLIELKLASGATNPGRSTDLADVVELIRRLKLPQEFGESFVPEIRAKYAVLWRGVQAAPRPEWEEAWDD